MAFTRQVDQMAHSLLFTLIMRLKLKLKATHENLQAIYPFNLTFIVNVEGQACPQMQRISVVYCEATTMHLQ